MKHLLLIEEDLLKSLIEEAVRRGLSDNPPYPSQTKQNDEVLTRNQAAAFLNLSPNTITKYVNEGKLKSGGTERKYSFLKSDLIKFMFNRK